MLVFGPAPGARLRFRGAGGDGVRGSVRQTKFTRPQQKKLKGSNGRQGLLGGARNKLSFRFSLPVSRPSRASFFAGKLNGPPSGARLFV